MHRRCDAALDAHLTDELDHRFPSIDGKVAEARATVLGAYGRFSGDMAAIAQRFFVFYFPNGMHRRDWRPWPGSATH